VKAWLAAKPIEGIAKNAQINSLRNSHARFGTARVFLKAAAAMRPTKWSFISLSTASFL
jgi:hypothetical protein